MERGLAASTVESYRRDLRRYASVLAGRGKTRLGDITPADVAGFLAALREGDAEHGALAVSSAARAVIAVRGLHAFAVAQGLAATDPAREVPPPSPPRRLPRAIPVGDVERLLDAAGPAPGDLSADPRLLRDRALLEFLYGTGARISEATGLDVDELQLGAAPEYPVVRLIGKGGKHRVVPMGSYAVRALEAYLVRARPGLAQRRPAAEPAPRCSSTPAAAASPGRAPGACCTPPPPALACPTCHRTRCATRSRPTCSTAAPTSGWSRNCSATRPSPPPRCTP